MTRWTRVVPDCPSLHPGYSVLSSRIRDVGAPIGSRRAALSATGRDTNKTELANHDAPAYDDASARHGRTYDRRTVHPSAHDDGGRLDDRRSLGR